MSEDIKKSNPLEEAVNLIREGVEETDLEMVLVVHNKKSGMVKIFGMRIHEEEVPMLLVSAANHVAGHVMDTYDSRTIN